MLQSKFQFSIPSPAYADANAASCCSRKHYREYLVSLINSHAIDPAPLYSSNELLLACKRYKVDDGRGDAEDAFTFYSRLLKVGVVCYVPCWDQVLVLKRQNVQDVPEPPKLSHHRNVDSNTVFGQSPRTSSLFGRFPGEKPSV